MLSYTHHPLTHHSLTKCTPGAFRDWPVDKLKDAKVADALKHPNWDMGKKITIDSATLMNKGLEVIEAHYLFGAEYDNIEIVIHPQSIIHSMVETQDSSVLAQVWWCGVVGGGLRVGGYVDALRMCGYVWVWVCV